VVGGEVRITGDDNNDEITGAFDPARACSAVSWLWPEFRCPQVRSRLPRDFRLEDTACSSGGFVGVVCCSGGRGAENGLWNNRRGKGQGAWMKSEKSRFLILLAPNGRVVQAAAARCEGLKI
jgi:hypothetical protein